MDVLGRGLRASALASSIVWASGAGAAERPAEKRESLSMVWFDSYGLCPLALRTAEAEAESLLKGMGVSALSESPLAQEPSARAEREPQASRDPPSREALRRGPAEARWAEAEARAVGVGPHGMDQEPGAAPIRFRVALLAAEPSSWGFDWDVLGAVVLGEAHPDVVFVFTANIIRTAGYKPGPDGCRVGRKQREIGRAVARIAIHEIVHAVAPEHPHADAGLMVGRISRQWLLEPLNGFDQNCKRAFVSRLEVLLPDGEAGRAHLRAPFDAPNRPW